MANALVLHLLSGDLFSIGVRDSICLSTMISICEFFVHSGAGEGPPAPVLVSDEEGAVTSLLRSIALHFYHSWQAAHTPRLSDLSSELRLVAGEVSPGRGTAAELVFITAEVP